MLPCNSFMTLELWTQPAPFPRTNSERLLCNGCCRIVVRTVAVAEQWVYSSKIAGGDGKYYCPPCRSLEES